MLKKIKLFIRQRETLNNLIGDCESCHCLYMREGEGSILGTFKLTKIAEHRYFLFVITQHIKELIGRKFSGLLRIIF